MQKGFKDWIFKTKNKGCFFNGMQAKPVCRIPQVTNLIILLEG